MCVPIKDLAWNPKTELLSIEIFKGVFDSKIPEGAMRYNIDTGEFEEIE